MKKLYLLTAVGLIFSSAMFGQITSNGTGGGNWSSPSTWLGGLPNGSQVVTIAETDSVYFDVPVTITDTIKNYSGRIGEFDSSKVIFGNGGVYMHAANSGRLPKATWNEGSTCLITALVDGAPSNGNQNFYNLSWDCPGQSGGLNLGMMNNTIGGTVRVINSNSNAFRLTAGNAQPPTGKKIITINGDAVVDSAAGYLTATGSGSPNDTFTVVLKGNIISKGAFQLANGSGGTVNWYVGGSIYALGGTFTTNSTATKPDSLFFNGTEKQLVVKSGDVASMSNIHFRVLTGSAVDMDTNRLGTSAGSTFNLDSGATLMCGHTAGINGNITVAGAVALNINANYVYDGAEAQATGSMLPDTVNNLTIDNAAGVTLSKTTLINGILALKSGVFDNTIPFTLGPSGSISNEGGSLLVTAVKTRDDGNIPARFFVGQNFPNPFNPSTTISFGLPKQAFVTVKVYDILGKDVATIHAGELKAGVHEVNFDASHLSTGIYFYRVQAGTSVDVKRMMLLK
jgi:hypothetical protein